MGKTAHRAAIKNGSALTEVWAWELCGAASNNSAERPTPLSRHVIDPCHCTHRDVAQHNYMT